MNGIELFLLGRRLMKIGQEAMPAVAGFNRLPSTVRSILMDVLEHPGTSISEITARTGLPQSQVSASVTRLREGGALETVVDRDDRRRTLVRPARRPAAHRAAAPVDGALAAALGTEDPAEVAAVVATLEDLAGRLRPAPGPLNREGDGSDSFEATYASTPPWDVGRPQTALRQLAEAGELRGRVLDAGCGTGEHALMAAALGLAATGVDGAPSAIAIAERKAKERGLEARFLVWDVLDLTSLGEQFDTVLDSGLFHVFSDEDRARYVEALRAVVPAGGRCFVLCFSDGQPGSWGPRRVTRDEIRSSFADGWTVDGIEEATFELTIDPAGARAWRAALTRV